MKIALAFSGGKDSWACLWLHEAELRDITVVWVNTGKNFPELLETIDRARAMCPNFHEVRVDRDAQNAERGLPSDIVPVNWTRDGQLHTGLKDITIQPYLECCVSNIGLPLHQTVKAMGFTHLLRGQRNDESHVSTARDGDVVDGLTYIQPIENWTESKVMAYLRTKMDIPEHFALEHSSMDCFDCTAYRAESRDRVAFMHRRHPGLFDQYAQRMSAVNRAVASALAEGV